MYGALVGRNIKLYTFQCTYIKILVNSCKRGICKCLQDRFSCERWGFAVVSLLYICIVAFKHTLSVMLLGNGKMWQNDLITVPGEASAWCINGFRGHRDVFVIANT